MSHEPPIPEAARSPYPLQPPPIASHDTDEVGSEASARDQDEAAAPSASPEAAADQSWTGRARETFDRASESKVALGAAVGIGSAALLAALLFTRRGRKGAGVAHESWSAPEEAPHRDDLPVR
jgi:predicted cobalt transporter CbtA